MLGAIMMGYAEYDSPEPAANPVAGSVSIAGTLLIGETLTGSYTYFSPSGIAEGTSTYKWYTAEDAVGTSKTAIPGETGLTYEIQGADEGLYFFFEVTPVDADTNTGDPAESAAYGPAEAAVVDPEASDLAISGSFQDGQTLTGSYTYFSPSGVAEGSTVRQWYRADNSDGSGASAISGATGGTYGLTAADIDKYIVFGVTPKDALGNTGVEVRTVSSAVVVPKPSGADWYQIPEDAALNFLARDAAYSDTLDQVIIVGEGSVNNIATSSDGGLTWTARATPNVAMLLSEVIWVVSHSCWIAVARMITNTSTQRIFRSTDGTVWTPVGPSTNANLQSVAASAGVILVASGGLSSGAAFHKLFKSTDGGLNWVEIDSPGIYGRVNAIKYSPELDQWILREGNGKLWRSEDDGATWTAIGTFGSVTSINARGLAWISELELWLSFSTTTKPTVHYSEDGIAWTEGSLPNIQTPMAPIWTEDGNRLLVTMSAAGGRFLYSPDGIGYNAGGTNTSGNASTGTYDTLRQRVIFCIGGRKVSISPPPV